MTEYKSKYINKTGNEITTSFDGVNFQPVNCSIKHHKNHYDLQCLEGTKMYLNLFKNNGDVIVSYMQHYKINDILDLASDGGKILKIDKKIKRIIWEVYMKKLNKICIKQKYGGYCSKCNQENKLQELILRAYPVSFEDMTDENGALGEQN